MRFLINGEAVLSIMMLSVLSGSLMLLYIPFNKSVFARGCLFPQKTQPLVFGVFFDGVAKHGAGHFEVAVVLF